MAPAEDWGSPGWQAEGRWTRRMGGGWDDAPGEFGWHRACGCHLSAMTPRFLLSLLFLGLMAKSQAAPKLPAGGGEILVFVGQHFCENASRVARFVDESVEHPAIVELRRYAQAEEFETDSGDFIYNHCYSENSSHIHVECPYRFLTKLLAI